MPCRLVFDFSDACSFLQFTDASSPSTRPQYKKEAVTHQEVLPWHQGGYEDHHGDLHGGVVPGGRFAAARLAGGVHRERARHDSAGIETSGSSRGSSAADVDEGRLNGTKPEWERHDEARGGDTREPGGGETTETLGNDVAFIQRLAASHEHKTGE